VYSRFNRKPFVHTYKTNILALLNSRQADLPEPGSVGPRETMIHLNHSG